MDIAFSDEKDRFVVIYLDDITMYSKNYQDYLEHLKRVFLKCRKFDIPLNPKKSTVFMKEGKLLGHIISKEGIRIDPDRVATIGMPRNKKRDLAIPRQGKFLEEIHHKLC